MKFKVGDEVRLADKPQPNTDTLSWEPEMDELCGRTGIIMAIDGDGDCGVKIPGERMWWFSPKWLTKVSSVASNKLLLI